MSTQSLLRRKIARREELQARRRVLVEQAHKDLDASIERAELELTNLRAQLTIGVVK